MSTPRTVRAAILWFALALVTPTLAEAQGLSTEAIGQIKRVEQAVTIKRGGDLLPASIGDSVNQNDTIYTDEKGAVGITLIDGSVLALGAESELKLDELIYDPPGDMLKIMMSFMQGTFSYMSGRIAKLSPENALISTPAATIGIRGTKLLIHVPGKE